MTILSTTRTLQLSVAQIRFRWRAALAIVLAVACAIVPMLMLGIARDSVMSAASDQIVGQRGYREGWAVQAQNEDAAAVLARLPALTAEAVVDGSVVSGSGLTTSSISVISDPRPALAAIVAGRRPDDVGEASVSRSVAKALRVRPGDTIEILDNRTAFEVVGITVDPGSRDVNAVVVIDDHLLGLKPTVWLGGADFAADVDSLSSAEVVLTSTGGRLGDLMASPPPFVDATGLAVRVGLQLLLLLIPVGVILAFWRIGAKDAEALVAAGLSSQDAWDITRRSTTVVAVAGSVGGSALAVGLMTWQRSSVSGWFGQEWTSVSVPWAWVFAVIALPFVVARSARSGAQARATHRRYSSRPTEFRQRRSIATGHLAVVAAICLGSLTWRSLLATRSSRVSDGSGVGWSALALLGVGISAYYLAARAANRFGGAAIASAARHLTRTLGALTLVVGAILVSTTMYVALGSADAAIERRVNGSPDDGSIVVEAVPDATAERLVSAYRAVGGKGVESLQLFGELDTQLRVTSPAIARCMTDLASIDRCMWIDDGPLSVIGVDPTMEGQIPRVAPGWSDLVLIEIDLRRDEIRTVATLGPTTIDDRLGGAMPYVVLPPALVPKSSTGLLTDSRRVAFYDFARLPSADQAGLRLKIDTLAPGALIADHAGVDPRARQTTVRRVISVMGALLAAAIVLIGGAAVIVAARAFRASLVSLGTTTPRRARVGGRIFGPVAVSAIAIATVAPVALSATGRRWEDADPTVLLPVLSSVLASLLLIVAFVGAPVSNSDE